MVKPIIFGAALLIVLMLMAAPSVFSADVQVHCFTSGQIMEHEAEVQAAVVSAYDLGHADGMMEAYDVMTSLIFEQCLLDDVSHIAFPSGDDVIYLACPAK